MKIEILKIIIDHFKGVSHFESALYPISTISGANATGKTTIADAHFWLWCDKNYAGKSNPPIYPLGVEEATPTVTEQIVIDGKSVKVTKKQTRKVGKPDDNGVSKVALSNNYEINDVPKSERDFNKYFAELGVDLYLFLPLSHPEAFTGQKAQDMRKVLFSMASDFSDKDIADKTDGCTDVAKLLENYSVDEISAMQKATMKKIDTNYGAHGELINSKIEGLELAKTQVDITGLAEKKSELQKQIDDLKTPVTPNAEKAKIQTHIAELKAKAEELRSQILHDYNVEKQRSQDSVYSLQSTMKQVEFNLDRAEADLKDVQDKIKSLQESFDGYRQSFADTKSAEWNPKNGVCPTCGQKLPENQIEEKRKLFLQSQKAELLRINKAASQINTYKIEYAKKEAELTKEVESRKSEYDKLKKAVDDAQKAMVEYPSIDSKFAENEEYQNALATLEEAQNILSEYKEDTPTDHSGEITALQSQISDIDNSLAQDSNNRRIDEQIVKLREDQQNYEQAKADAEKILYELDLLSKAKNDQLAESVNSHFKLVKFLLFDFLKNGEYKETCIPTINGKRLGESVNTALGIEAKIDIINGLSKFYDSYFPVFLDNSECLDDMNKNKIVSDSQLIFLSVSDEQVLSVRQGGK